MTDTAIIINATALGAQLTGIGVYLLELLRALAALTTDLRFIVYVNEHAKLHVEDVKFPPHMMIRWTSRFISPDYKFAGHLLRLLYSNYLSLRHRKSLCVNGSQLEAMLFRGRQILAIHDIIPLQVRGDHKKQYYYFRYLLPHALRSAFAIIVPSLVVKEHLAQAYGLAREKVHVIYHGVEHAFCDTVERTVTGNDRYILFVGRGHSHKNLEMLLRGFKRMKNELSHKLVIVDLDRRSKRRPADPGRIVFKGYVSNRERSTLYRNASLLVFPSLHEGFGFPPLEAMLNACPVVASNASCIPEVCGDAAHYIDPNDIDSIADGMYRVATDNSLRNRLVERGLQRAKMFSWTTSAKSHLRLFGELLSR